MDTCSNNNNYQQYLKFSFLSNFVHINVLDQLKFLGFILQVNLLSIAVDT